MPRKIAPWCTSCGNCLAVCPAEAVWQDPITATFSILREACTDCGDRERRECERHCPSEAILPAREPKRPWERGRPARNFGTKPGGRDGRAPREPA